MIADVNAPIIYVTIIGGMITIGETVLITMMIAIANVMSNAITIVIVMIIEENQEFFHLTMVKTADARIETNYRRFETLPVHMPTASCFYQISCISSGNGAVNSNGIPVIGWLNLRRWECKACLGIYVLSGL